MDDLNERINELENNLSNLSSYCQFFLERSGTTLQYFYQAEPNHWSQGSHILKPDIITNINPLCFYKNGIWILKAGYKYRIEAYICCILRTNFVQEFAWVNSCTQEILPNSTIASVFCPIADAPITGQRFIGSPYALAEVECQTDLQICLCSLHDSDYIVRADSSFIRISLL